ncbi:MAG TPA: translocation/assembly module TamB domain-containing protein, partial [Reyranellaceae bacterium]|nr:translocation/assembly module TamB domain-containing protein [Reyranellaceae bacterium]
TAPLRGRLAGDRFTIEQPGSFKVGPGTVRVAGTVDATASDLAVELAALPLASLKAFAPGLDLDGTLQAKARITGALAMPRIEATYAANGVRLRRPGASFLPPIALNGTASLAGSQATYDAKLAAGGSALALKGTATLPQGRRPLSLQAKLSGAADLGLLAPFVGTRVRNLQGRLQPDFDIRVTGNDMSGNGRLTLAGAGMSLPDAGLRLDRGEAAMTLRDDTVQIERLRFHTTGGGELAATGTARLDPAKGAAVALQVTMQKAMLANRSDLIATASGNLRVTGSTADGFDVAGPVTIDRAEINIGQSGSADYPTIEVREVNKPGVPNAPPPESRKGTPPPKPAAGPSVRLALTVDAPRAVFVRGRGLDAEVGGTLKIGGIASQPTVTGGMTLRRGEFSLAGRRLVFSRGNVSLVRLDSIEPMLDFVATTTAGDTTINVLITGTSREPKIALNSSPSLPQDELMAMLLFGRTTTSLSPFEMVQVAQAIAELTGKTGGTGLVGSLRKGLGLDRLSIDSGKSIGSTTIEGGRYVAPGVYVGTKQGASGGSSRGVVEFEVLRRTKIEADYGADSRGRLGVKMEWDY